MSSKIIQVNARLLVTPEQFEQACTSEAARPFADVPGLDWKIWILNREQGLAGGIKFFADEACLADYLNSPMWASLPSLPFWTDFQATIFEVLPVPSNVTRAPIHKTHPLTFGSMLDEALQSVPLIKPADAFRRMQQEPDLLLIDVRDSAEVAQTGKIRGSVNLGYGALTYLADNQVPSDWRDARLADRSRPIITTCIMGPLGALGGNLLQKMGFTNIQVLEGGVQAWIDAGLPVEMP